MALGRDGRAHAATGHWWAPSPRCRVARAGSATTPCSSPTGRRSTVAKSPAEAKDRASHRALAGAALVEVLRREGVLGAG